MKGLDLRNFKKVKDEKGYATLKHPKGHEVRIAKNALSESLRDQLSQIKMPMKQVPHMSKGGDPVDGDVNSSSMKDSPDQIAADAARGVNININTSPSPEQSQDPGQYTSYATDKNQFYSGKDKAWTPYPKELLPKQKAPQPSQAPVAQPAQMMPSDLGQPEPQAPQPSQQAMQPQPSEPPLVSHNQPMEQELVQPSPVQRYQDHKQAVQQELTDQDKAWQQDLQNGHITPETYESLFHKKDTLGKIGTIFGMLLSGAGSGLAKQPNMLLAMMDKEITNDLEAQKFSKDNAVNYLKLHQSGALTQAQIGAMASENALRGAQQTGIAAENKLKEAQVGAIGSENQVRQAQIGAMASENALRGAQQTGIAAENKLKEAQVGAIGSENQVRQAQIGKIGEENKLTHAQSGLVNAETNAKAYALARMQMNVAALHKMAQQVQSLPLGSPQRQQAEQTLALMNSAIQNENYSIADRAASASAYGRLLFGDSVSGGGGGSPNPEGNFQRYTSGLKMLGPQGEARAKDLESKHVPGFDGQASIPIPDKDRDTLKSLNNFQQAIEDGQQMLKKAGKFGYHMPSGEKSAAVALSKRMELEIGNLEGLGRFTPEEAKRYKDMIPDFAGTHFTSADQEKLNSIAREISEKRKTITQYNGLPGQTSSKESSTVKVISPDGQSGTIPKENLQKALNQGYREVK